MIWLAATQTSPARKNRTRPVTLILPTRPRVGLSASPRTVERYDQGQVNDPPVRQLLALAQVLGVELDDILEDAWRPRRRA